MKTILLAIAVTISFSAVKKSYDEHMNATTGITHVTSDPSVSVYLVEIKEFKGSRAPAIVSNR